MKRKLIFYYLLYLFVILLTGCDNIRYGIDTRLNGKWYTDITYTMYRPIDQLPPEIIDIINQNPDVNEIENVIINRETGMIEFEVVYKMELKLNNGKYEYINSSKGNYTTNNGIIKMKPTHVVFVEAVMGIGELYPNYTWHTKDEYKKLTKKDNTFGMGDIHSQEEYFSEEEINNMFSENIFNYYLNGNTLVFNNNGEITIYNRE